MKQEIDNANDILCKGGVILYPSDTIWGLGCDATNNAAIERLNKIKQRSSKKSSIVLVDSPGMLSRFVREIPDNAWDLVEFATNPLTIIYPEAVGLADNLISEDKTIAIRVVNDEYCRLLIGKMNKPLVSTSANISGQPSPDSFSAISDDILNGVDYIVNLRQDEEKMSKPSPIIRLGLKGEVEIIRD